MVSKTVVIKNEQKINAKSVMNIIAGCMKCGSQIEVECDGADEQEACESIAALIESGLGE